MLAAAGLFVTGVLSGTRVMDLDLPCGDGGCEIVSSSAAAAPGGFAIAYVGLAFYGTLFTLSALDILGVQRGFARTWCGVLSNAGVVVSLGLTIYSVGALHATCAWCLASASVSLFLFAIAPWCRSEGYVVERFDHVRLILLAALPLVGAFLYLKSIVAAAEQVPFDAQAVRRLPTGRWMRTGMPTLGEPGATRHMILFGDFTCGGCRNVVRKLLAQGTGHTEWTVSFRHLLPHPDPDERRIAALLETAAERGRFWDAWALAARQGTRLGDVETAMGRLSLPDEPSPSAIQHVQEDRDLARRAGFRRTPTLVETEPNRGAEVVGPQRALRDLAVPR